VKMNLLALKLESTENFGNKATLRRAT